ncbi:tRNA uridine-5-carboxymethylaminomethyl(34) synthesis enzyme MnmG [candidate division KSB1 bacterium]
MGKENKYDIVVIGAGHAGCEAALFGARSGFKTLLITMNRDAAARMSCNPAIGGLAKGHLVREIDALGGEMAKAIDAAGIQFRMLNKSKGPAVWSPRAQADKELYSLYMRNIIDRTPNLDYVQDEAMEVNVSGDSVSGITLKTGNLIQTNIVIITSGTFLEGRLFRGKETFDGGREGEPPSVGLSKSITNFGLRTARLKTGTPPRLKGSTINWSMFTRQDGDEVPQPFSYSTKRIETPQIACYLGWTSERIHDILREGFGDSPLFTGKIRGTGPRYCPSIEDKINRFSDKDRHQLFLEPEGLKTESVYLNGFSTSLPSETQLRALREIPGFEKVEVLSYGYAVEYDYFPSDQLNPTLESQLLKGLFFAGQVNGTSGYEEAASQGIIAGINAVRFLRNESPFILKRSEAYIGVLIDDIITKPITEPYRLFTSSAEYRLLLRQDNADERLMRYGNEFGLISDELLGKTIRKKKIRADIISYLKKKHVQPEKANPILEKIPSSNLKTSENLHKLLKRPEVFFDHLLEMDPFSEFDKEFLGSLIFKAQVEMKVKYKGYIDRLNKHIEHFSRMENSHLPKDINYAELDFLSLEAREKLQKQRPVTLGQTSRIAGISSADII